MGEKGYNNLNLFYRGTSYNIKKWKCVPNLSGKIKPLFS